MKMLEKGRNEKFREGDWDTLKKNMWAVEVMTEDTIDSRR